MSFDIVFSSCRTNGTKERTNPFTGKTVMAAVAGPLTSKEKKAVNKLLAEHNYDSGQVHLPENVRLEIQFDDDLTGGMISLRDAKPTVFSFLFRFADAGHYVLCPIMEDNPTIVTTEEAAKSASKALTLEATTHIHVATNANEIAAIIYPAFGDWNAYRKKFVPDSKR
jgi:hypothetical protein